MWPSDVVVLAPVADDHDGSGEAGELFDVEQFVADAGVERRVLPRRAGVDERRRGGGQAAPVRDPEAFSPPPLQPLAIDRPAELTETDVRAPVAPARPLISRSCTRNAPSTPSSAAAWWRWLKRC
jgi:hypothetical protein